MENDWFSNYKVSNGILRCLSGTQADNHYLNWCIVHYVIPHFNRVSIMWNTEMSGAKACTLTHVWRFNPTEMAFLLDTAALPYKCIEKQERKRRGRSQARTCKMLLDAIQLITVTLSRTQELTHSTMLNETWPRLQTCWSVGRGSLHRSNRLQWHIFIQHAVKMPQTPGHQSSFLVLIDSGKILHVKWQARKMHITPCV